MNLIHLTQDVNQQVGGPIQDDEALMLFAVVRGCRFKRILEIGGLFGYSAKNFCEAVYFLMGLFTQ
jgi:predicted O-methyltransferase YrrM